jgi:hypothetical protein
MVLLQAAAVGALDRLVMVVLVVQVLEGWLVLPMVEQVVLLSLLDQSLVVAAVLP